MTIACSFVLLRTIKPVTAAGKYHHWRIKFTETKVETVKTQGEKVF
jgi:hypothetical protein